MKKLIFIFLATVLLFGCSKNDETPTAATDQLPPATQTGSNKVGCLVNGQVLLPRGSNPFGPPISTCYYQFLNNDFEFGLGYTNNQDVNFLRSIYIFTNKKQFIQGQTYIISNNQTTNSIYAQYSPDTFMGSFNTNLQNTGELLITKLDQTNAIISGTFWFDAVNSAGAKVQVREGRFDMQYSQ